MDTANFSLKTGATIRDILLEMRFTAKDFIFGANQRPMKDNGSATE
jgi:hypothetical protein